jgi:hypothetical protein
VTLTPEGFVGGFRSAPAGADTFVAEIIDATDRRQADLTGCDVFPVTAAPEGFCFRPAAATDAVAAAINADTATVQQIRRMMRVEAAFHTANSDRYSTS